MTAVPFPAEKVLSREAFLARFRRPRDYRLVFTNGCFDILHRGHVEYLHQARALGDVLVVGVNTDASVEGLKGPGRPVVPQDDRALVLSALESVDAVTLFHEDTPESLIASLLPDVLVKGGDYSMDQIVGREAVEGAGGEVKIIPFIQGRSTTDLFRRIREEHP
ncbi:MAG: D-glycero-beta-D-manno-heptose 1-phosphate adenylyltransferase [Longimicrobiales bacterium]|nr:D-glycero-beta-D-manno-heptose 1-phosphate adenylyltransferase [Longimicrobiales bacterium]